MVRWTGHGFTAMPTAIDTQIRRNLGHGRASSIRTVCSSGHVAEAIAERQPAVSRPFRARPSQRDRAEV